MSLFRDLLRVSEINRIMRDRLDFICDVEIDESLIEPAELNPLDMRPLEFRVSFGMSKEFFKKPLLPIHRLAIFLQFLHTNGFYKSVGTQFYLPDMND